MFRPRVTDTVNLMRHMFPGTSASRLHRHAEECAGDMRHLLLSMRWGMPAGTVDAQKTIFEGTRGLCLREIRPSEYVAAFSDVKRTCMDLAFRNASAIAGPDAHIDQLADIEDAFSCADAISNDATWTSLCRCLARLLPATRACPPLYLPKALTKTGQSCSLLLDSPPLLGGCTLSCSAT